MAISRISAPPNVGRIVELSITSLGLLGSIVGLRSRDDGGGAVATDPVPLHGFADTEALGEFDNTDFPQFGWRTFVSDKQEGVVAVDIADEDGEQRFDRIISGPLIGNLMKVAEQATFHAELGTFTLRLVDIPALKIGAIWLDDAANSLFLPYAGIGWDQATEPLGITGFYNLVDARTMVGHIGPGFVRDDLSDDDGDVEPGN